MFQFLCLFLLLSSGFDLSQGAMTEKQIKSAAKLMRNACQPKHKVSDALIEDMHKGVWTEDDSAKCYMFCVMVMSKVVTKTGDADWDAAYKAINDLPAKRVPLVKASMDKCRVEVPVTSDKCDSAWKIARCMYFDNPDNYFMP